MNHLNEDTSRLAADRKLWISVLCQAIEDATGRCTTVFNAEREQVIQEAREWLTKPSSDLENVCDLANVEMHRFIAFATARIKDADSQPRRRKKHGGRKRLITNNGETLSISEWASRIGITPQSLSLRLHKGMPLEQALTHRPSTERMITFEGRTQSVAQWARQLGIKRTALVRRLATMPIEKAMTLPPRASLTAPGGGHEPRANVAGPVGSSRALSAENRVFEDQDVAA